MGNPRHGLSACVLAAVFLIAGCSSVATTPPPSAAGGQGNSSPAAPSGQPVSPTDGAAGSGGFVDVCQVVTEADVAPFFTTAMNATSFTVQPGVESTCSYQVAPHDGLAPMQITEWVGPAAEAAFAAMQGGNNDEIPLPGIGDTAIRTPNLPEFGALKGSTFCQVSLGSGNSTHYVGLPSPDPSGLVPDAAALALVQRLEPLCVKLFSATGVG
jgi:hypothetical protein